MILGHFTQLIDVLRPTPTTLGSGQIVFNYSSIGEHWAKMDYMDSKEAVEVSQRVETKPVKFTIHNIFTVLATDVVKHRDVLYEIVSIVPVENEMYLEITAQTRDNQNLNEC
jgi:SPP1 family predicted phage head-tail adaptor